MPKKSAALLQAVRDLSLLLLLLLMTTMMIKGGRRRRRKRSIGLMRTLIMVLLMPIRWRISLVRRMIIISFISIV